MPDRSVLRALGVLPGLTVRPASAPVTEIPERQSRRALRILTRGSSIMRWIMSVAILAVLVAPAVRAHPLSVAGTITQRHDTELVVKSNEGYLVTFTLDSSTVIQEGEKRVDITELKPGRTVVVEAVDDTEPLVAYLVTIIPSTTPSAPK
jgi:hypothetical protein